MATAAVPASTAAESREAPPGYRLDSEPANAHGRGAALLVYLSLLLATGFATCHQLSVALPQAYLEPSNPELSGYAAWLCAVCAIGAAAVGRSYRTLTLGLMIAGIGAALVVPIAYFAFERGADLTALIAVSAAGSGIVLGAVVGAALRRFGKPAQQLDAVGYALRPFALAAALGLGALGVAAFGIVGPWRATGILSLLLSVLCAWTMAQRSFLESRRVASRLPRTIAALGFCLGLSSLITAERFLPLESLAARMNTVVYRAQGEHYELVVTSGQRAFELYVDGRLRASTIDAHRYYEALALPALAAVPSPKQVLILNGGTGLTEREALRFPGVEHVTTVCPEPALARIASSLRFLRQRNRGSLQSSRLQLVIDEPVRYVERSKRRFDVIIVDVPDPLRYADAAAYSVYFYKRLKTRLSPHGVVAVQGTSPFTTPRTFATVDSTLERAGFSTSHYRASIPTFGDWGFLLARTETAPDVPWQELAQHLRAASADSMRAFPMDTRLDAPLPPSTLYDGRIVEVFAEERERAGL